MIPTWYRSQAVAFRSPVGGLPYAHVVSVAEPLAHLRAAAGDGRLETLAQRHGIALVTIVGSALGDPARARDLDVAVSLPEGTAGLVELVGDLADLDLRRMATS